MMEGQARNFQNISPARHRLPGRDRDGRTHIDISRQNMLSAMEASWNSEKNRLLLKNRGVCFEMVMEKIIQGDFRGPEIHPIRENQFRIIVFFQGYPYVVPMVID
jgi:hypothetical protein